MYSTIITLAMASAFLTPDASSTAASLPPPTKQVETVSLVPVVPFYSQFDDISSPKWQKVGCGVTSLAMVIEYYKPEIVSVDTLLEEGLDAGAFINNAGWSHAGLIKLARTYGLDGEAYDFGKKSRAFALAELEKALETGPVIVSVHYKFQPQNPIPHLAVINGIEGDTVYYNDPASKEGGNLSLPLDDFLKSWKQRFIAVRPVVDAPVFAKQ